TLTKPKIENTSKSLENNSDYYRGMEDLLLSKKSKKLLEKVTNYQIKSSDISDSNMNLYEVEFKEGKNSMRVTYSRYGEILKSAGTFQDVRLPYKISSGLAKDYPGWEFKNTWCYHSYDIEGNNTITYKVLLQKGNETKKVKINPQDY
ncbi:MAG: hypothetical protein R3213_10445, partial [Flavobacteriaceae bacterium]|nr:hypothetical protein [Flavobacteriaceae bacterium]